MKRSIACIAHPCPQRWYKSGLPLPAIFHGNRVKRCPGWPSSKQGTSPSTSIHQWLASSFFRPQISHVNETSQTIAYLILSKIFILRFFPYVHLREELLPHQAEK